MLEKMKLWLTKPLHAAIAAFIAGLFIGLVILGWWLWPVQWYDASPSDLRPDAQQDYVCMMIDSYSVNQNGSLAVRRYAELGDDGPALVAGTTPTNCPGVSQEAISSFQAVLEGSAKLKRIHRACRRFLPLALAKPLRRLPVRPQSPTKATILQRIQDQLFVPAAGAALPGDAWGGGGSFLPLCTETAQGFRQLLQREILPIGWRRRMLRLPEFPPARNQPPSSSPPI